MLADIVYARAYCRLKLVDEVIRVRLFASLARSFAIPSIRRALSPFLHPSARFAEEIAHSEANERVIKWTEHESNVIAAEAVDKFLRAAPAANNSLNLS